MKSNRSFVVAGLFVLGALTACGGGDNSSSNSGSCPAANTSCTTATGPIPIPTTLTGYAANQIPVYVSDANTTGPYSGFEQPLVSVTICTPGHTSASQCQVISNVLLDTGSYGLRVFGSAINSNVQLTQQTITVQGEVLQLAEIAEFGTGSDWGAVKTADVILGNQTATNTPVQVIDPNFAQIPSELAAACPDTDPCTSGVNGILGVGLFAQDCGLECVSQDDEVNPGLYFGCDTTGCFNAVDGNCGTDGVCMFSVPTTQQVINPIAKFASGYNNGLSLTLPSVNSSGAAQVVGSAMLGIGSPTSVTLLPADPNGLADFGSDFRTVFEGNTYGGVNSSDSNLAFIDSGSNGLFFPSASLPTCQTSSDFYCGTGASYSAVMEGFGGSAGLNASPSNPTVTFSIGNADQLFTTSNTAFNNVGGPSSFGFDWGLPFFFGRTIYVGIAGTNNATVNNSPVSGPFWAF